ncbi:MAG: ornithine--oxo-acid transaminase [Planctomycetota bacterium]
MSEEILHEGDYVELERRYAAHNYKPLDVVLCRGEGVWVHDVEGRRYLDCLSAYSAVNQGHGHPRILAALEEQARRLAITSRAFRNDRFGPLCRKLSRLFGYEQALLMNSGAEAVETAIKAARRWAYAHRGVPEGEAEILAFEGNFHGRTTTIVGFSTHDNSRRGFGPFTPGFRVLPYGDAGAVAGAIGPRTAAVLVEPIQGEAGVVIPPEGFLRELRALCDEHGVLLICDEIQSGLGRAGRWLAQEREGVRADGVTIGKALSGGVYPVSAFLADERLMSVFDPGSHGSTFGGNPLACAVAEAALDVIEDEDLCARSERLGAAFLARLRDLRSPRVRALRGAGLWIGIQLEEREGGARRFSEALQGEGLLLKETRVDTLRFAPPLVIGEDELDMAYDALASVLA